LSFKKIHDNETEVYSNITNLLKTYNLNLPSNKQLKLFAKLHNLHNELTELQKQRVKLVKEVITEGKLIYVRKLIDDIVIKKHQKEVELIKNQKSYVGKLYNIFYSFFANNIFGYSHSKKRIIKPKKDKLAYLSEQYHFFIRNVVDFTAINKADKLHLCALILRIMATPVGQRLIFKLNLLKYQRKNVKISIKYGKRLVLQVGLRPQDREKCKCEDSQLIPEGNDRQAYKKYDKKGQPVDQVFVIIPENYLSKPADIVAGKTKIGLIYHPQFISLLHEFIHCLHKLRGRDRSILYFRHSMRSPIYYLYYNGLFASVEEKWTIEYGNISENKARKQNGLPLRLGFLGAILRNHNKPPDFSGIIFFAQHTMGRIDFKEVYIEKSNFKFPFLLNTKNLKGITGISFAKYI
jgi:hypothetical protein